MRFPMPINKKNIGSRILYHLLGEKEPVYVDSALLYPINSSNQYPLGILEISNNENEFFGFDEEYFGIILETFCNNQAAKLLDNNHISNDLKQKNKLYLAFNELVLANNKKEFSEQLAKQIYLIFGFHKIKFYFIENQTTMINYLEEQDNGKPKAFPLDNSLCAEIYKTQTKAIIQDIRKIQQFNSQIDLDTILPIYVLPLVEIKHTKLSPDLNELTAAVQSLATLEERTVKAILQIALKSNINKFYLSGKEEEDQKILNKLDNFDQNYRCCIDENLEFMLEQFAQFAVNAMLIKHF